jgi:hypothetical protein
VLDESVVFGFVSPVKSATTPVPHEAVERITRTAFVEADPPTDHAS